MKTKLNRGFTLIELLVVIVIIGILSTIVLANLSGSRQKGRDARRMSDLAQYQLVLEQFFDRCRAYPSTIYPSGGLNTVPIVGCVSWGTFLSTFPKDPNGSNYEYIVMTPTSGTLAVDYVLKANLELKAPSDRMTSVPTAPSGYVWSDTISCSTDIDDYCVTSK